MAASINSSPVHREQDLLGQTVLVIGGSSGIGLETARLARAQGAGIILTARDPDRLHRAGLELGASIAAFDATDFGRLGRLLNTFSPTHRLGQASWYLWPWSGRVPCAGVTAQRVQYRGHRGGVLGGQVAVQNPAPPMVVASFTSRSANSRSRS